MKKIILASLLIILIPTVTVFLFIEKEEKFKFNFISNMSVRVKREKLNRIDNVPLEDYIVGVLSGEMPVSFELEALKAQALAARSYVMNKMKQNKEQEFDVVDTVSNQVYQDDDMLKEKWKEKYDKNIKKIKTAVFETQGQYLTYQNEVIQAFFFSTSTGKTENVEEVFVSALPYLRSVDSSWDEEVSPVFRETNLFTLGEFYQKLNLPYQDKLDVTINQTTSTGRIKELTINGTTMKSSEFYSKLHLRSTYFEIKQDENQVQITTRGYGHGVGMSQYGAEAMAKKGYTYDKIVKYYYQGVEITKI